MFRVLSLREEQQLGKDEILEYYVDLKDFILNRKLTNTTPGALTVAPKLKKITNKIATKVTKFLCRSNVEIIVDGKENIPEAPCFLPGHIKGYWMDLFGYRLCQDIVLSYMEHQSGRF